MKLYTKTGDKGQTGLIGGVRVSKDDARVACYGDVDELNATVGLAVSCCGDDGLREILHAIQSDLFVLGTQLATQKGCPLSHAIGPDCVEALENQLDATMANVKPLRNFVLPGGCELAARFHHARTVCRRVERSVVSLAHESTVEPLAIVYLNRLGDLLFALALSANRQAGVDDIGWIPETDSR